MTPRVTGIRETRAVGQNGQITTAIVITYMVGTYGPFTLTTTQQEIDSGAAQQAMQKFASTLGTLPTGAAS
ncbi:MAG TPA: hypothetical protein VKT75_05725 [Acidobacteriaceae bacterium]|nr:hypothetical protein [Acidobacteriaceae bacterium]